MQSTQSDSGMYEFDKVADFLSNGSVSDRNKFCSVLYFDSKPKLLLARMFFQTDQR